MKRLTPARDRELRHAARGEVAWRWSWQQETWYAWCRTCGKSTTKQVDWLIGSGFLEPARSWAGITVNVLTVDTHVKPYLERYPR